MRRKALAIVVLILVTTAKSRSDERRFVSIDKVFVALAADLKRGEFSSIKVAEDDIDLPIVPVSLPNYELRVIRINLDREERQIEARLACRDHECLPFHIRVRSPQVISVDQGHITLRGDQELSSSKRSAEAAIAVHSGDSATLVSVASGLRLTVSVVCLQSGRMGQLVRLRTTDTKKILVGRVEGPGLLSMVLRQQ